MLVLGEIAEFIPPRRFERCCYAEFECWCISLFGLCCGCARRRSIYPLGFVAWRSFYQFPRTLDATFIYRRPIAYPDYCWLLCVRLHALSTPVCSNSPCAALDYGASHVQSCFRLLHIRPMHLKKPSMHSIFVLVADIAMPSLLACFCHRY